MKTITVSKGIAALVLVGFSMTAQAEFRSQVSGNRLGRFAGGRAGEIGSLSNTGAGGGGTFYSQGQGQGGQGGGFGGGFGGRPGGPPGEGGRRPQLTAEQQSAFDACLAGKGVSKPTRPPEPTDAQRAQMQTCREQSQGDREAMKSCMTAAGFTPPERPSSDQMQALHACRSQVLGK